MTMQGRVNRKEGGHGKAFVGEYRQTPQLRTGMGMPNEYLGQKKMKGKKPNLAKTVLVVHEHAPCHLCEGKKDETTKDDVYGHKGCTDTDKVM